MFLCEVKISSNCGLSKLSEVLETPINVSYVNPLPRGRNMVLSYARAVMPLSKVDFQSRDILENHTHEMGKFFIMNSIKRGHGIIHSIVEEGGFPVFPVVIEDGIESVAYLVSSRDIFESIIQKMGRNNHIEDQNISKMRQEYFAALMNINYIPLFAQLTSMELDILRSAVSNGYYEWPRDYNLDAIAGRFNLRKPTVLYHLRNAEKKIFGLMFR